MKSLIRINRNRKVKAHRILSLVCILLSFALILAGVALGQPDSVMTKAIGICLECIGIG